MKKTALILSVIIGSGVAIISALPLAWIGPHVVPAHMAQNARFHGTIWQGQADMAFGKSRAPLTFKTSPAKLLTGREFLDFSVQNSGFNLQGLAGFKTAKDVQIDVAIAQLPLLDPRIRGLHGDIKAQVTQAKFGSKCKTIEGQAETDFMQANEATWFWQGPKLAGPLLCDEGDIVIDMRGQSVWDGNKQDISAQLRFKADGVYTVNMRVETKDKRAAVVLGFYGFEPDGIQFVLSETGRWY
ncbi:MAG: type II secretion system protein N [Litorimonas sp.]